MNKYFLIKIIAIAIIFPVVFLAIFNIIWQNKFFPKVTLANIDLDGKTYQEAKSQINQIIQDWQQKRIIFKKDESIWSIGINSIGFEANTDKNLLQPWQFGRTGNLVTKFDQEITSLVSFVRNENIDFRFDWQINETKFNKFLNRFSTIEDPAQNPIIFWDSKSFTVKKEKEGKIIDRERLKNDLEKRARSFSNESIELLIKNDYPTVTEKTAQDLAEIANTLVGVSLKLKYKDSDEEKVLNVEKEKFASWLNFVEISNIASQGNLKIEANTSAIKQYLDNLSPEINQEPVNAQLAIENGRAAVFALAQDGIKLKTQESSQKIAEELTKIISELSVASGKDFVIPLIDLEILITKPEVTSENIENLGITSLIGVGKSNFAGSPKNRRHNIAVGAAKFHGVLIKPGEEFSFNKTLGPITTKAGYRAELVIKKGETVPELGGGICQVSTTAFRAAIYAGLPITERRPHAYPVKYYNPQGMDATVYPPHPDLRFINDTPGYILIQTKIEGNGLTFEFYGTDDGRQVKIIGPTVYAKKPDGSMKAVFEREIYRDDQLLKKETFRSSYNSPNLYPHKNPLE